MKLAWSNTQHCDRFCYSIYSMKYIKKCPFKSVAKERIIHERDGENRLIKHNNVVKSPPYTT